jgi:hypothetical protein
MLKAIAVSSCLVLGSQGALADDSEKLIGTWKLNSCMVQFQDGSAMSTWARFLNCRKSAERTTRERER